MMTSPDTLFVSLLIFFLAIIAVVVFCAFTFFGAFLFILWYRHRHRESEALNSVLLQISLPRDNDVKIDAAEQLFSSLASMGHSKSFLKIKTKEAPHISLEIVGLPGDIRFYVHVSNKHRDFVEKQINGAYPDAEITVVSEGAAKQRPGAVIGGEYNIFSEHGHVAFASLRLKGSNYSPIKSYKELATDPLSSITSILAKMTEGEGAAIQILISPADHEWKHHGKEHISHTKKTEANPETAKYSGDAKELEAIENKVGKPGFETIVRIVVSSSTHETADAHLENIVHAFGQYEGHNSFTKNKYWMKGAFVTDFIYRYMPIWGKTSVMSSEELATIFHFPNKAITTPGIHWISSKRAPAPSNIPTTGTYLGKSTYRGMIRPVYIERDDRRRHTYIIGKTGTGKSEFLKQMIMQDIRAGEGLAVVDPHGDLVEDVLQMIPPNRAEDVILFDPSDIERPLGMNMLFCHHRATKAFGSYLSYRADVQIIRSE